MMEIWKAVEGFEDYQVSNFGRVKRKTKQKNNHKTQKILSPGLSKIKNPRPMVVLYNNGKPKTLAICRLVLHAFKGTDFFEHAECNHKDGNRKNNNVSNLEWVSGKENVHHALKTGLRKNQAKGEKIARSKLKAIDIPEIRKMIASGKFTLKEIGKKYNVRQSCIWDIKHSKTWQVD